MRKITPVLGRTKHDWRFQVCFDRPFLMRLNGCYAGDIDLLGRDFEEMY